MSSAYIQSLLKQVAETPRIIAIDPELMLERIAIIKDIETCYHRGLITALQVCLLDDWLSTGIVQDRYSLLAALEAIATVSRNTDEYFAQQNSGGNKSLEQILHDLFVLSEDFTSVLDFIVKEENNQSGAVE